MKKLVYLPILLFLINCSSEINEIEEEFDTNLVTRCLENDVLAPLLKSDVCFITLENGMNMIKIDSMIVDQGDIVLTDRQLNRLIAPESRGSVLTDNVKAWPYGIVFYEIRSNPGYPPPKK